MEKKDIADFASVDYTIYLREENIPVGYISLKFNAHIEYKIYESYVGHDYAIEALAKFIEVSSFNELFVIVRKDNQVMLSELAALDFEITNQTDCTYTCRFRKRDVKKTNDDKVAKIYFISMNGNVITKDGSIIKNEEFYISKRLYKVPFFIYFIMFFISQK